jgi:hypothetical protein
MGMVMGRVMGMGMGVGMGMGMGIGMDMGMDLGTGIVVDMGMGCTYFVIAHLVLWTTWWTWPTRQQKRTATATAVEQTAATLVEQTSATLVEQTATDQNQFIGRRKQVRANCKSSNCNCPHQHTFFDCATASDISSWYANRTH